MSVTGVSEPLTAWQRLRVGNERYYLPVNGHRGGLIRQRPTAVVFRCSDSGVAAETVFGQNWGSLIDVSTWGHVIDAGVLATLDHAVGSRQVPLVVVLGHHDCDAARAAMQAWNEADMPSDATRAAVEQMVSAMVRRCARTDSLESVTAAHLVETGVGLLEHSPTVARRIDAGECAIVCATVEPAGNRLRVYGTIGSVGEISDSLLECV